MDTKEQASQPALQTLKEYAVITAGIFLTALAVYFFMMPANIVLGSVTGLAIVLVNFIPLQVSAMTFILNVLCLIIGFILFRFTKFGTYLKAIGAGEKAAMFSGIRTDRMKFLIYTLAGAITGFAAFINVIKVGSVTSSGGNQLETQILIALVLGGMPISGGAKVRFENIIVGSLLYIVLNSGLTMMGFTTQMMQLIQGVVFLIFVAVFADRQSLQVIK